MTGGVSFLELELTGFCQLACRHCYADSGRLGTHGTMTAADWRSVIDQASTIGVERLQFIGGEPTLHPAFVQLLQHDRCWAQGRGVHQPGACSTRMVGDVRASERVAGHQLLLRHHGGA